MSQLQDSNNNILLFDRPAVVCLGIYAQGLIDKKKCSEEFQYFPQRKLQFL